MRFVLETLGCKVNQYESQAMVSLLEARGHRRCPPGETADCVIVNTCAVTGESGRKSRQAVRRLQKLHPGAFTAVCGCYSQIAGEELNDLNADLIGGSGSRLEFLDRLEQLVSDRTPTEILDDPMTRRTFETLPAGSTEGRTRAMLKIQDGCVNFCTYCIIPYARGPVRSMPLDDVRRQAAQLAASGFREIVVTGIEISSYGKERRDGTGLIDALEAMANAAPGVRLHLGSLEPRTVTEEFCRRLKVIPDVCPHFHLSLQSGCDDTLRRMHRKYDTARFLTSVDRLREAFPNCGVTTDLIVGFPGETEAEFERTLDFLRLCQFSAMHVFPYSQRPGTPAASMPEQVPKAEKQRRAALAADAGREMAAAFAEVQKGRTLRVLFETEKDGFWYGHSENYLETAVKGAGLRGRVLDVRVTGASGALLSGQLAETPKTSEENA
ncbi:MAG: tRNA (N(6)-L-threonylcarbamoyladenosine(37)-C(2))-methylthiotransferase MtaB [Oscillospiraceae bacterium]|nr:tRNA (N(6)-L-threonylcarbamoyladenosine(37)-C(2))-methylthiotransferase MtaB [Oscillospiraceae bacterium]